MNYYIWDKQTALLGIQPNVLLDIRPDFKYDDVIVITNEEENVITVETKTYFKDMYNIESDDPDIVALAVIHGMDEDELTIEDKLQQMDEESDYELSFTDILEDVMNRYNEKQNTSLTTKYIDTFEDPYVKIIDLSDVSEDVESKKLTVVFQHAFITEIKEIEKLKFMSKFKETEELLLDKKEKALHEGDDISVELIDKELKALESEIEDTCDITFKVDAKAIYHYDSNLLIECENGQMINVNSEVIESLRESAIEYEKSRGNGERYKVHYKTVNIELSECYNEVIERGNSVFIIEI